MTLCRRDLIYYFNCEKEKNYQNLQGNENYAFVGLYDARGGTNRTRSVGLVFWYDSDEEKTIGVHLEVVYNEENDPLKLKFYDELVKRFGPFDKEHERKYKKNIGYGSDTFANAEEFLNTVKPQIDQLVKEMNVENIFIDKYFFDKQLENILKRRSDLIASTKTTVKNMQPQYSLNTILYGPPGTGKTFNTVNVAVQIADPTFYKANESDRDKLVARFNQLLVQNWDVVDGQIGFITFHQNYSYEEFVQGLRPDLSEYTEGLAFELRDGIFKRLADRALANKEAAKNAVQIIPTFDEVFEDFFKDVIESETAKTIKMETEGYTFDITKYNPTQKNFNFKKKDGGTAHNIYVPTLKALYDGSRPDIKGLRSYYLPLVDSMKERAKEMVKGEPAEELKNYVLIVDEINRANISRVFGELITLIETDKRWGAKHQLKLTLPSGDKFTVPDNLYIVGTMNTADKSLALLDIALRRRFSFIPKYPDDKNVVIEAQEFFNKLNEKIFKDKSADFTIGHSYFMKQEDKEFDILATMNENVIPLLQEYFYSSKPGTIKSIINSALEGTPLSKYEVVDNKYGLVNFVLKNE